mmetsp:Transcript_30052/g.22310  ORF Transcript_30052/g.22310 Transcript_30052/m.22310 type:complete len:84 (+) Transcript_30052:71-322(+)
MDKPKDPVPYIYSYLLDMSKGQDPRPITDNELNELRNLRKKVDYLKDKLEDEKGHEEGEHTASEDEDDDEVHEVQPKKKNIKA